MATHQRVDVGTVEPVLVPPNLSPPNSGYGFTVSPPQHTHWFTLIYRTYADAEAAQVAMMKAVDPTVLLAAVTP